MSLEIIKSLVATLNLSHWERATLATAVEDNGPNGTQSTKIAMSQTGNVMVSLSRRIAEHFEWDTTEIEEYQIRERGTVTTLLFIHIFDDGLLDHSDVVHQPRDLSRHRRSCRTVDVRHDLAQAV
jgi:hypothetical protein